MMVNDGDNDNDGDGDNNNGDDQVKRYFRCFSSITHAFDEAMTIGSRVKTDYDVSSTRHLTHAPFTLTIVYFLSLFQSLLSYFTSEWVANAMKYTDRHYRSGEYIAEVLKPIRTLEIFLKYPAGMCKNEGNEGIDEKVVIFLMGRNDYYGWKNHGGRRKDDPGIGWRQIDGGWNLAINECPRRYRSWRQGDHF